MDPHVLRRFAAFLAVVTCWLVTPGARAEDAEGGVARASWLLDELGWAERAAHPWAGDADAPRSSALAELSGGVAESARPQQTDLAIRELERTHGRFRTMKVAGYTVAAFALAVTLGSIPIWQARREHVDYYGSSSCGLNVFPYVAAPVFAGGLTSGILGSLRSRAFVREHGTVPARRSAWRVALAGIGVTVAIGLVLGTVASSNVCSS